MCVYFGSVGICVFHHDIALIAGTVSTQQTSMCMCVRESNQIRERSESMTALEITFLWGKQAICTLVSYVSIFSLYLHVDCYYA